MSYLLFKKIIDEAKESVHSVNLHHRGEALFHQELPRMIRYCKEKGIYTQLHTNGTLLTPEKALALIDSGLDFISFSMDGYDKASYEQIRVGACYEKTVANIREFLKIKGELTRKNPRIAIEMITIVDEKPPVFHEDLRLLAKKYRVEWIVKKPHNWAGGIRLDTEGNSWKSRFTCTFPWYSLTILWDGTVVTCPQDFFGENVVGDISVQRLDEIWNGAPLQEFRRRMKAKVISEFKTCTACDRPARKRFLGIPTSHLMGFFRESV